MWRLFLHVVCQYIVMFNVTSANGTECRMSHISPLQDLILCKIKSLLASVLQQLVFRFLGYVFEPFRKDLVVFASSAHFWK